MHNGTIYYSVPNNYCNNRIINIKDVLGDGDNSK